MNTRHNHGFCALQKGFWLPAALDYIGFEEVIQSGMVPLVDPLQIVFEMRRLPGFGKTDKRKAKVYGLGFDLIFYEIHHEGFIIRQVLALLLQR
jgi:hypothetical protein